MRSGAGCQQSTELSLYSISKWHRNTARPSTIRQLYCIAIACLGASELLSLSILQLSMAMLQGLREHKGQRLLLSDAARLAGSLADGLVHCPVPDLAVPVAVPRHLALAHLQKPQSVVL